MNSENKARDALSDFLIRHTNRIVYMPKEIKMLESRLNALWAERCKANDELVNFIKSELLSNGYTFKFASDSDKQLKIVKETKCLTK